LTKTSHFIQGPKNENFTMVPTGTFRFVALALTNPPVEIGEIIGIIVREYIFQISKKHDFTFFKMTYQKVVKSR